MAHGSNWIITASISTKIRVTLKFEPNPAHAYDWVWKWVHATTTVGAQTIRYTILDSHCLFRGWAPNRVLQTIRMVFCLQTGSDHAIFWLLICILKFEIKGRQNKGKTMMRAHKKLKWSRFGGHQKNSFRRTLCQQKKLIFCDDDYHLVCIFTRSFFISLISDLNFEVWKISIINLSNLNRFDGLCAPV